MFFATPHHGTDPSHWKKLVSDIVTRHGPEGAKGPTEQMLLEIQTNSQVLTDLSEGFAPLYKEFDIVSFWEGNTTGISGDVVRSCYLVLLTLS
jgi:hypothetical protein